MLGNLFKKKKDSGNIEWLLKFFRIEMNDGKLEVIADFADEDILLYYRRIANFIQRCLRHNKIEHYLTTYLTLAGQPMEISMLRQGEKGPTALYEDAKTEIINLKSRIAELEKGVLPCS